MRTIDLNCDMGESRGGHIVGDDAAVMPFISSANIACGYHGGDEAEMDKTLLLAKRYGVAAGAHPSFLDLEGFGRREMEVSSDEVYALVKAQVLLLQERAHRLDIPLHHVKPHGALYNMAARRDDYAAAIARAVAAVDPRMILYGLSGSALIRAGREAGLATCAEVFADRTYQRDGSLTRRSQPGAMIEDAAVAVEQVMQMVMNGQVCCVSGEWVAVEAGTVCIHGDQPGAVAFARLLREALAGAGVVVRALR